jgi:tetratricopeptide (TPR) repeat protein
MVRWLVVLAALFSAATAAAADKPRYAPPADWVKPHPIPNIPSARDGSLVQLLLLDSQTRLGTESSQFYAESAIKILSPQGLALATTIPFSWSPDTETLTIHRVEIVRDGKTIDLLANGKNVTVLRRETNLELAMLDGRLTATLQPEGLQVGDILDIAMTVERNDPVLKGRSEASNAIRHPGVAGRVYIRETWSDAKAVRWKATEGLPTPTISHTAATTELVVDQSDVSAPKPPKNAPARFTNVGALEVSEFQSWSEVAALMAPLYEKASKLTPNSPLHVEVDKIRAANGDPKARAEAALRLVQEKVRYVALFMNFGGYVPADADVTWTRRFGDCKAKSALLLALLHELGIEAEPALVNVQNGDALGDSLPMLSAFNHVLVRARIDGKTYWLDGTRPEDRGLDDIPIPEFRWALPVQSTGAQLEKLEPRTLTSPEFESTKQIDTSAGLDAPASVRAEQTFRGDRAVTWHIGLSALGHDDAERTLREYWRGQISWTEPKSVNFTYDEIHRTLHLTMEGQGKLDWISKAEVRDFDISDSNLGFETSFRREPGPYADAPISVSYPSYSKWTVIMTLPRKGAGFLLMDAEDVDKTVAGRRYQRRSSLQNGVVTMTAQEQSLASEFPMAEADTASAELRRLTAQNVVVRQIGGSDGPPEDDMDLAVIPSTAAEFSRRGVTFLNRQDYDRAIADFSEAARLEPKEGKHYYNRGAARVRKGDDTSALADFNEALRLNPQDSLAYLARGELLLRKGDEKQAWADLDQAVRTAHDDGTALIRRAEAYASVGRYADAVRDLSALLLTSQLKSQRPIILNARCWTRAEWGQELQEALADCNAALDLDQGSWAILDSRGFVELRLGQYDKAIADYDRALELKPRQASSLLGRGFAKRQKGQVSEGEADITAAQAISPGIDQQFAKYGVKRPST